MFPSEPPPRALDGFEILERLGAGGVGEVFLARSRGGKLVAIKTVGTVRAADERRSADVFAREAAVCVRLQHPCIVQVRAFLEDHGFAALVFEYVPGVALGRVLRLCHAAGVRLPDRAAWHIVERVLTALAYAHAFRDAEGSPMPIVHRDISPSNVLLDWGGGVKIADFGIAKMLGVSPATRVGLVKGTPGCMAPEQARGEPVDERADVYAAALLAWRLATGRSPFGSQQREEVELFRAMRHPRIKPLGSIRPELPEPLLAAVMRALEPERTRRSICAAELAEIVRRHVDLRTGWLELASRLESWKPALERTVRRGTPDATSFGDRSAHTVRYEEMALAFDDEPSPDGPTVEAHALPSDLTLLAELPLAPLEESQAPPRWEEPNVRPAEVGGAGTPAYARPVASRWPEAALIVVGFGMAALLAERLATCR
jgi:eukaryotic-like serine/threonine-protein kinase